LSALMLCSILEKLSLLMRSQHGWRLTDLKSTTLGIPHHVSIIKFPQIPTDSVRIVNTDALPVR